jgi:transketolase
MEILSQVHSKRLEEYGYENRNFVVLTADLTDSCEATHFKGKFRERFYTCGIAEQNMVSVAGGLAREGVIPFIHTFAVFIYRRAYDQIAMSVAYPNVPVKMFGFLPGIMTPGGASHQAIEDIAIMRSLPNMTVLEAGDATEVESMFELVSGIPGPVYVRALRGEIPRLFEKSDPIKLDTPRIISQGSDLLIFSSGICTEEAIRAVTALKEKGLSVCHVHISTLKPFNNPVIKDLLNIPKYGVITVENHTVIGGLGTIIAEKMAEYVVPKKLVKLGLQDMFSHGASKRHLMRYHRFDAAAIIEEAEKLTGESFGITEKDLTGVRIEAVHSDAKPEGL